MIKRLFIIMFVLAITNTTVFSTPKKKEFFIVKKISLVTIRSINLALILSTPLIGENDYTRNVYNYYSHFCHQIPQRSFFINDRQVPVCARCTGIALGNILGELSFILWDRINPYNNFRLSRSIKYCLALSGCILPLIIDGSVQLFTDYESNNILRLTTGILFGISFTSIIDELFRVIDYYM